MWNIPERLISAAYMCYALIHSDSEDAIRYLYSVIYFLLTQTCSALWHKEHNLP